MATNKYNREAYLRNRDNPEFKRKRKEYSAKRYQLNQAASKAASRAWALANPERTKEISTASRRRRLLLSIYRNVRKRAKKRGMEFSITYEDLVVPDVCPIFGEPLVMDGTGGNFAPSLDRIDNTKGYIPGNVQVISLLANCMKWTSTPEQLAAFCRGMLKYLSETKCP